MKRRWWRLLLIAGVVLMGGLVMFHRPLVHWVIGVAVPRLSAKYDLPLTLKSSGSIWRDLTLSRIKIGKGVPDWLQVGEIDELSVAYDWRALKNRAFERAIRSVKVHGAVIQADLRLLPKRAVEERKAAQKLGLKAPPLVWPEEMDLDQISMDLLLPDGSRLVLSGFTLQVFANRPGRLGFKQLRLDVPPPAAASGWVLNDGQAAVLREGEVLIIENLTLPFGVVLARLELDLSGFAKDEVGLALALTRGVATWESQVKLAGVFQPPMAVEAEFEMQRLRSADWPEFDLPAGWDFESGRLSGRIAGEVSRWHQLAVSLELADATLGMGEWGRIEAISASMSLAEGQLGVELLHLKKGSNEVLGKATLTLPDQLEQWATAKWQVALEADLPELRQVVPPAWRSDGKIQMKVEAQGTGRELSAMRASGALSGQELKMAAVALERLELTFDLTDGKLMAHLTEGVVTQGNQAELAATLELAAPRAFEGKWRAEVGSLETLMEALGMSPLPQEVTARFVTEGEVAGTLDAVLGRDFKGVTGVVSVKASDVTVMPLMEAGPPPHGSARVESLDCQVNLRAGRAVIEKLDLVFDPANRLQLTGAMDVEAPHAFQVSSVVKLAQLHELNAVLGMVMPQRFLAGKVEWDLQAEGQVWPWRGQGQGDLSAQGVQIDKLPDALSLTTKVRFEGSRITLSALDAELGDWKVGLNGVIDPDKAELAELSLARAGVRLVEGRASLPFAWFREGGSDPQALALELKITAVPVHEVLASLGINGTPQAMLNGEVSAQGALDQLAVRVALALTEIRMPQLPASWAPASMQLQATLVDREAKVEMVALQAPLSAMNLTAAMPINLRDLLKDPGSVRRVPIVAGLRLPETKLDFLKQFAPDLIGAFPAVLKIEADLTGTLERPALKAALDLDAKEMLLLNPDYPSVREIHVRVRSDDQSIRLEEASMLLAGGSVKIAGEVGIEAWQNPTLDLRLTAREALVYRDPSVSVRADADLTCRGDWESATVAGEIGIVRGRVYKEIDVAPALRLPTSAPALAPDPARTGAQVVLPSFLEAWHFDVGVRTRDPLLLTGNLFNGAISADLKLSGTGANPRPTGAAKVERFLLRLPFSSIKVTSGTITLNPDLPYDPQLDLRAESRMSSHFITLFAFGPLSNLKTRLTSSPPMREPDIATLLATGTTLGGDGAQLASEAVARSLYLYLSEFYRKTFNRQKVIREDPPRLSVGLAPSNVGAERAGNAMQATYDLSERWRLIGQFARSGRVRAALGFLIRFGKSPPSEPGLAPTVNPLTKP